MAPSPTQLADEDLVIISITFPSVAAATVALGAY